MKAEKDHLSVNIFLFIVCVFFIVIGNTGIWFMPNLGAQHLISQSLTHIPFDNPGGHYIMTNYLQPFIFGILGGKSLSEYMVFTFATSLLFLLIFIIWFLRYHQDPNTSHLHKLVTMSTFPVFMIPFYWVGMDGMTLLLMLLIMINFKSAWSIVYSALLGIQHFEQGIIALLLLSGTFFFSYIFNKKTLSVNPIKNSIYALTGILFGKLILIGWFYYNDIILLDTRSSYLESHIGFCFKLWIDSWPFILYSLFGVGWLLILKEYKLLLPLIVPIIVAFVILITVSDQTRVGAIILFPSLFYWVFMNRQLFNRITLKFSGIMLIFYLTLPVVYVWGGPFFGSLLRYDSEIIRKIKNPSLYIDLTSPFKLNKNNWI